MVIILEIYIQMNTFVYMVYTVSIRMKKIYTNQFAKLRRQIKKLFLIISNMQWSAESFVSDEEMAEILSHKDFAANAKTARKQIKSKEVRFV